MRFERTSGRSGVSRVLRSCIFTMFGLEAEYSIQFPDQPCGSQGMQRGLGPVVER